MYYYLFFLIHLSNPAANHMVFHHLWLNLKLYENKLLSITKQFNIKYLILNFLAVSSKYEQNN